MEIIMPKFENYIRTKYGGYDAFLRLKATDKEKIFLKYKWGHENNSINYALESGRRGLMSLLKSYDYNQDKNQERAEHIKHMFKWEEYCFEVKKDIGLVQMKDFEEPDIVKQAREMFKV